jgi:hypothetical protein
MTFLDFLMRFFLNEIDIDWGQWTFGFLLRFLGGLRRGLAKPIKFTVLQKTVEISLFKTVKNCPFQAEGCGGKIVISPEWVDGFGFKYLIWKPY